MAAETESNQTTGEADDADPNYSLDEAPGCKACSLQLGTAGS